MSSPMEEIIGAVQSRPGQPVGQILGGQVVPLSVPRAVQGGYQTFESLAAEVQATMDRLHPALPEALRRIRRSAETGRWVRIVGEHGGETHEQRDEQGAVVATWAVRIWRERAIALDLEEARQSQDPPLDYFWAGKGWVRHGTKREWEDELNVGNQARQAGTWELIENRSPRPGLEPPAPASPPPTQVVVSKKGA